MPKYGISKPKEEELGISDEMAAAVIEQSNVEISFILQYYTLLDRINHHFYLL